jgi:DNA-binding response OmpR family regulator
VSLKGDDRVFALCFEREGGGPMGAIAKSPISQLLPAAAKQVPRVFLDDSQTSIQVMDLNEAHRLSQFATVIVLMPALSADDKRALSNIGANNSVGGTAATSKILEFFNASTVHFKSRSADSDIAFGDVRVNFSTMEANRDGEPVMLTALEFKTLKYLIQNASRVISRDELLNEVWGYENYPSTRTVDNQVAKLRKKLERDPSQPVHLRTVHGAGYKFLA